MRYVFGFLFVCALGVMPVVACNWEDILGFEDPCDGVECQDDGNDCTVEFCGLTLGLSPECRSRLADDGALCRVELPWVPGGVCKAGACAAPCDPASEEMSQCPINLWGDLLCCPGREDCTPHCN